MTYTHKLPKLCSATLSTLSGLAQDVLIAFFTFSKNLPENRVKFPEERNDFVLDHQHGRRDVTCKPPMGSITSRFSGKMSMSPHLSAPPNSVRGGPKIEQGGGGRRRKSSLNAAKCLTCTARKLI